VLLFPYLYKDKPFTKQEKDRQRRRKKEQKNEGGKLTEASATPFGVGMT
jgi:hypothetical protein